MGKLTKNQKLAAEKIEAGKAYSLKRKPLSVGWNWKKIIWKRPIKSLFMKL